jgi:hypothetical protein
MLIVLLLLELVPHPVLAETSSGLTKELHSWGRFKAGAWKRYRVVTEALDENGKVVTVSTTETKASLAKVDPDGVTLDLDTVVEVAGRRLGAEPKQVRQGFHGEALADRMNTQALGPTQLKIDNRMIPCQVELLAIESPTGKTTTKIFFSKSVAPYVLRRESNTMDPEGHLVMSESTTSVVSLDMPCKVLSRIKSAAHVVVETSHPKGSTKTWAYTSIEVPGGIVCQTAYERDSQNRLIRRSTLELVDYGLEPEKDRPLINRWRSRTHKTHRANAAN